MIIILSHFINVSAAVRAEEARTGEFLDTRGAAGPQLQPAYRLLLPW